MKFIQAITFNKAELMGEIKNRVAKYEGVKYGEEEIKEAKGDRATLNKFREAMEDRRKEIKAWWNEPYIRFEKDVKEVLELIDKPIKEIDEQIKGYEERKKEEKKVSIQGIYNASVGVYEELLPLSRILNMKWLKGVIS
jgi:ClpP class serine protease